MSSAGPNDVVIVGSGMTGTTALYQLVEDYPVHSITVLEDHGEFGPGFPYQRDESREYLINNTNDTMCLEPTNRRAFHEWLEAHPVYSVDLDAKGHMPRAVYGEFLCDVIARCTTAATEKGIDVQFIEKECLDIEEQSDGRATVHWQGGSKSADMVILATGRCPDFDAFNLDEASENYFSTHIPGSQLDRLPLDAEVHVLGASLSAYDVVNQLFAEDTGCRFVDDGPDRFRFEANGNERRIVLCSRSGRLKKCQSRHPTPIRKDNFDADAVDSFEQRSATLEQIFELMLADARSNGATIDTDALASPYAGCDDSQSLNAKAAEILEADIDAAVSEDPAANFIVDYLDQAQFDIWDLFATHKLTESEELRYRKTMESALLSYSASCPILTAKRILALMQAGRLRIVHGVQSVSAADDGFDIEHALGRDRARVIVNATSIVDRDVTSSGQSMLTKNLVKRGVLRPYQLNGENSHGIDVDMQAFLLNGSKTIYAANMFLWGPGFFTSAAIVMATVIQRLLAAAYDDGG
ncbi:MAG: FAD/NAD(P)-binding protein [Woeseiaceae bacterium]